MATHLSTGKQGEQLACQWLEAKGFSILHRNWRHGRDEIDIVARDGEFLVVVEVKTRSTGRWGDPEAQAVLALLQTDMIEICDAIQAGKVDRLKLQWQDKHAVAVVLASKGYPDSPVTGFPISIKDDDQINICFGGVTTKSDQLFTSGGRVMTITALAQDQLAARTQAYEAINNVHFEGMHYRTDIGLRANSLKAMETK